jgi:hypothetical protein
LYTFKGFPAKELIRPQKAVFMTFAKTRFLDKWPSFFSETFLKTAQQGCQMVPMLSNQKSQYGCIFVVLGMEIFSIFVAIYNILRPYQNILWYFGIFCDNSVYFFPLWFVEPKKSGNPAAQCTNVPKCNIAQT